MSCRVVSAEISGRNVEKRQQPAAIGLIQFNFNYVFFYLFTFLNPFIPLSRPRCSHHTWAQMIEMKENEDADGVVVVVVAVVAS